MDLNKFTTNDSRELIVRGSHKKILFFALIITVPCVGLLTDNLENWKKFFTENLFASIFFTVFFYGGTAFFWFKVFDKRIKLIINKNGIWYSKASFVNWNNVWHFHVKEEIVKACKYHFLIFKTKNNDTEYKVDITLYDKSYKQIQEAINNNSEKYSIIDLGFKSNK